MCKINSIRSVYVEYLIENYYSYSTNGSCTTQVIIYDCSDDGKGLLFQILSV